MNLDQPDAAELSPQEVPCPKCSSGEAGYPEGSMCPICFDIKTVPLSAFKPFERDIDQPPKNSFSGIALELSKRAENMRCLHCGKNPFFVSPTPDGTKGKGEVGRMYGIPVAATNGKCDWCGTEVADNKLQCDCADRHADQQEQKGKECECQFIEEEGSWHFERKCPECGSVYLSLHCEHDGNQGLGCPYRDKHKDRQQQIEALIEDYVGYFVNDGFSGNIASGFLHSFKADLLNLVGSDHLTNLS